MAIVLEDDTMTFESTDKPNEFIYRPKRKGAIPIKAIALDSHGNPAKKGARFSDQAMEEFYRVIEAAEGN